MTFQFNSELLQSNINQYNSNNHRLSEPFKTNVFTSVVKGYRIDGPLFYTKTIIKVIIFRVRRPPNF